MSALGKAEENTAADYLTKRGLRIISRNYRCKGGELDLVALHNGELVFVEVRYRAFTAWGDAVESVGKIKQRRWMHAARYFCLQHPEYSNLAMRFDLVAIQGYSKTVNWIQNVSL